jgi:hypothetical protein
MCNKTADDRGLGLLKKHGAEKDKLFSCGDLYVRNIVGPHIFQIGFFIVRNK